MAAAKVGAGSSPRGARGNVPFSMAISISIWDLGDARRNVAMKMGLDGPADSVISKKWRKISKALKKIIL